ncbi:hypothetical protein Pcinc_042669 [Petrolisthes cinctipes]|uniref:NR LBD domain-containing protein n=1 Tax=Petrolisthes cinctipes TaxID=88211 RepID=A0AAE1BH91_PETCI|nr:hypothetical protein Pcinc_042669 [Petrolisthes cinctipes]
MGMGSLLREDVCVQLLVWVVKQCRSSPYLSPLSTNDLLLLLTRAWPQLLLLHAACCPSTLIQKHSEVDDDDDEDDDVKPYTEGVGISVKREQEKNKWCDVKAALRTFKEHSLDTTELLLLSAVIILRIQPGLSLEGHILMTALQERAQSCLHSHSSTVCPPDPLRASNLLLLVALLHHVPRPLLIHALTPSLVDAPVHTLPFLIATLLTTP